MNQREIHHEWQAAGLVTLSRPVLLGVTGSLVVMTGMLMLLFSQFDLDTWLDRRDLAIKVGGSSLTLEEFRQLKEAAPPAARTLSNQQFAAEVVETLLLAEAGRHLRLDRHEEYLQLREAFDQAAGQPGEEVPDLPAGWATGASASGATQPAVRLPAGTASPAADLVRAWFLIEELARLTRARIAESAPDLGGGSVRFRGHDTELPSGAVALHPVSAGGKEPPWPSSHPGSGAATVTDPGTAGAGPETAPPTRLHLQKLVVADETAANQVLELAAAGIPFPTLNASFSRSLYVAVGGDLGWKKADDLPPGVFDTLAAAPVGSLTRAYADTEGVHLFLVKARPAADPRLADRQAAEVTRLESRRLAERRFLQTMRSTLPIWVHPTLAGSTRPE